MVVQTVKNPPTMQEIWVQSLSQEDPLEKGMATHFSILPWRIPWTELPSRLQSMASKRVVQSRDWVTNTQAYRGVVRLSRQLGPLQCPHLSSREFSSMGSMLPRTTVQDSFPPPQLVFQQAL